MKILHLSSERSWRGGEQQIAYLIEELLAMGHPQVVVCKKGSAFEQHCRQKGWPHHTLPFRNSLDLASAWQLRRICHSEGADLLHVHSSRGQAIAHLAGLLGSLPPQLLTRRVAFPINHKGLNVLRYNAPQLKQIICISEAVKAATTPVLKNKEAVRVIYDGIDLSRFGKGTTAPPLRHQLGLPKGTPLIGTVAALTAEKDISTFVRTSHQIAEALPGAYFVVVGDGPEQDALQELARQLGLSERLYFLGRRSDVPELLPQLSLFLFTSRQEGLGTSVLDAFACRVPVVSTNAGGLPEIVRHEQSGLVAPVGDTEALAAAAIRLLQNPELQQQLRTQAFHLLSRQFTKEKMAAETLRVYEDVLSGRG
ncbi:glycosyltransferase family 4 protein [Cesiribacter andamanensis]|uniref:GDP-mannose-dependent alpha-(1-6)-phosphatidylinositol monomannoside mannosyltransferase n=1 Tax=Cesiribacter andamanensis AMV16 TaxID=1279009 RepID=M7NA44_9BACT|nr:glycosyltransferase family 4 protein [Cesiribacter andamanensis]EMR04076.1 GDP-mannose-dependent alpha-(1-6)-phosphatidylinositol monomannoside mannosyltransferase [Cesiribacter andamanensis AMV16]